MIKIEKQFFSATEVGQILGISRRSVYYWIKQGKLKFKRIGVGVLKMHQDDLDDFIRNSPYVVYDESQASGE